MGADVKISIDINGVRKNFGKQNMLLLGTIGIYTCFVYNKRIVT